MYLFLLTMFCVFCYEQTMHLYLMDVRNLSRSSVVSSLLHSLCQAEARKERSIELEASVKSVINRDTLSTNMVCIL